MLAVLGDPILPIFSILAIGFVLGRMGVFDAGDGRLINRLAMSVLLPLMIFGQLSTVPIHTFRPVPILIYAAAEVAIFGIGFWIARSLFRRELREAVLLAMCGVYSNTAIYILAISLLLYGENGVLPVTSIVTLDSIFLFGGALVVMQLIDRGTVSPLAVVATIGRTPMLIAILIGVLVAALSVPVPGPVSTFLDFTGAGAAPVALFALGLVLSETRFRPDSAVVTFTLIKLAVFPAAVWFGLQALTPGQDQNSVFLLASAGPAGAMALSIAVLHGVRTDAIAQVVVWTSVLTLFTLAALA